MHCIYFVINKKAMSLVTQTAIARGWFWFIYLAKTSSAKTQIQYAVPRRRRERILSFFSAMKFQTNQMSMSPSSSLLELFSGLVSCITAVLGM